MRRYSLSEIGRAAVDSGLNADAVTEALMQHALGRAGAGPAYPVDGQTAHELAFVLLGTARHDERAYVELKATLAAGMTKRELAVVKIVAGLVANSNVVTFDGMNRSLHLTCLEGDLLSLAARLADMSLEAARDEDRPEVTA